MKAAIAIFVKTPGLSPLKTRLASVIGRERAEEFHRLAASRTAETVCAVEGLVPYWAVAERAGLSHWKGFEAIWQGEGGLGERLHAVYSKLLERHGAALLIGADSPHVPRETYALALRELGSGFVIGEAEDGGFYLFGGTREVPREDWLSVEYSSPTTAAKLRARVGRMASLPVEFDVDEARDLERLRALSLGGELGAWLSADEL